MLFAARNACNVLVVKLLTKQHLDEEVGWMDFR
jgi:hypothetical protein